MLDDFFRKVDIEACFNYRKTGPNATVIATEQLVFLHGRDLFLFAKCSFIDDSICIVFVGLEETVERAGSEVFHGILSETV